MKKRDLAAGLDTTSAAMAEMLDAMAKLGDIIDEHDRRFAMLGGQVAEQNLRILFLLHKLKFKVRPQAEAGIIIPGAEQRELIVTGYEYYMRERPRFLADLERDMQIARQTIEEAESRAAMHFKCSPKECADCAAKDAACDLCYAGYLEKVHEESAASINGKSGSPSGAGEGAAGAPAATDTTGGDSALPESEPERRGQALTFPKRGVTH